MTESAVHRHDETVLVSVPLQMRVAITLYKFGSCGEYRIITNQSGEHKCTVKKFVYPLCIETCKRQAMCYKTVVKSKFEQQFVTSNAPKIWHIPNGLPGKC